MPQHNLNECGIGRELDRLSQGSDRFCGLAPFQQHLPLVADDALRGAMKDAMVRQIALRAIGLPERISQLAEYQQHDVRGDVLRGLRPADEEEVIELQRMVLQEAGKFSDIAGTFYRNAIQRTVVALADWLRMQQKRGLIELDDVDEAAGMLLGMVTSAPRRAALFGRVALPSRSRIEARVRSCAAIFLHGCQAKRISGR